MEEVPVLIMGPGGAIVQNDKNDKTEEHDTLGRQINEDSELSQDNGGKKSKLIAGTENLTSKRSSDAEINETSDTFRNLSVISENSNKHQSESKLKVENDVIPLHVDTKFQNAQSLSVLVHYSDHHEEIQSKFRVNVNLEEVNALQVIQLKSRILVKAMSENEAYGIRARKHGLQPSSLSLSINKAYLHDQWTCRDFGLHRSTVLFASVLDPPSPSTVRSSFSDKLPLFTLLINVDGYRQEKVEISSGDIPERVVETFAKENSLGKEYIPPILGEVYKGLAKAFSNEVRFLHAEIANLMQQNMTLKLSEDTQDISHGTGSLLNISELDSSRDVIIKSQEALLSEAANQIQKLEAEKQHLSRELFEIQSSAAEKNNPNFGSLLRSANEDREKLVKENARLRELVYAKK
mmetsp:Transcript_12667/g.14529  ORF Transcript_12667/g.14529 Transcript_12667/m.14529 type:complete len:407 (+) Transcript_12667:91-1311(+)